ncbi:Appr-1-p processing protein [Rhodococcus sp. Eu-32]|uniref:type II toxin-antitoxin system antitoxin DNA ADP-ribosyl glycohydrolase DarG n=1 Tax=Rhodococcus sp. Eu-32 TaxID=1017319 RepID=UPI000DF431BC|nr:macro domain-containing protein [Rhodococcus sp. Eu-32]RRQ27384.1 Appr-1-p processing protein [Rhodococcus sp. Eu-32]
MLTTTTGNLLRADTDALVNTVNTVGVMGKGIALQFRRAYPDMFKAYATASKAGEVQLGHVHVWETGALDGPRFIINFPTKGHWRAASKLRDIEAGLSDLTRVIRENNITSIAIPPLGCGNGGLDWADVLPLIRQAFAELPDVEAIVYAPDAPPTPMDMGNATERPNMTVGRAALVTLLDRYAGVALGATPIEVQKLMYFLQVLGEPLNLNYAKNLYGPYADNLRHVLNRVEGHFLTGYGDGTARVLDADPIRVLPGAVDEAAAVLAENGETEKRVEKVLDLIDGFESMYSMELLATVHWVMSEDAAAAEDCKHAVKLVHEWTPRKRRTFTEDHIHVAWRAMRERGLISAG